MQANYGYRVMNRIGNFDKNSKRNIEAKCSTILDSDKDSDNYNVKMYYFLLIIYIFLINLNIIENIFYYYY